MLFVNDSKATNADSAAKALASFHDIFWIAGGRAKTGGITSLAEFFPRIRKAYLIGEAAEDFAKTLDGKVPYEIERRRCPPPSTPPRAMPRASGAKEPVVLLSPACASFDQYRELRGAREGVHRPGAGAAGGQVRAIERRAVIAREGGQSSTPSFPSRQTEYWIVRLRGR